MAESGLPIAVSGMSTYMEALKVGAKNLARSAVNAAREDKAVFIEGKQGVTVKTVTDVGNQAGLQFTGRELDIGIDGNGYYIVKGQGGDTGYVRTGSFSQNEDGVLADEAGNILYGWKTDPNGNIDTNTVTNMAQIDQLTPVVVNQVAITAAPTTKLDLGLNLPATDNHLQPPHKTPIEIYDSLGQAHTLMLSWQKLEEDGGVNPAVGKSTWELTMTVEGADPDKITFQGTAEKYTLRVKFDGKGSPEQFATLAGTTLTPIDFSAGDKLPQVQIEWNQTVAAIDNTEMDFNLGVPGAFTGITQIGTEYSTSRVDADGLPPGSVSGVSIDTDGKVYVRFDNGEQKVVSQLALANFSNENALERASGGRWVTTAKSGNAVLYQAKMSGAGAVSAENIEGSSIDQAKVLSDLVLNEHNVAANARAFKKNEEGISEVFSLFR